LPADLSAFDWDGWMKAQVQFQRKVPTWQKVSNKLVAYFELSDKEYLMFQKLYNKYAKHPIKADDQKSLCPVCGHPDGLCDMCKKVVN
jgi:hypothetical protein